MIRDFTDEARQTFYELPKTITPPEAVTDLMNILADLDYRIKIASWFWDSVLESLVLKVSNYIEQFIDFEGHYQRMIDNIFENVSNVENDYSLRLETMTECMKAGIEQFRELSQIIAPDRVLQLKQMTLKLKYTIGSNYTLMYGQMLVQGCKVREKSEMQAEVERYIDIMTQNRYNGKDSVKDMKNIADIQNFVYLYEYLHPDTGEKMDVLLNTGSNNPLTQDDKDMIRYIAYTADEPYRSLYLGYVGSYTIGAFVTDESGNAIMGAYYSSNTNAIYFKDGTDAFLNDRRGPYTTWFHESGHATDWNAITDEIYSRTYNDGSLKQAIWEDVKKDISSKIEAYTTNEEVISKILETFFNGGDVSGLEPLETQIRKNVILQYDIGGSDYLGGADNEAACDIYGGVTNLVIDAQSGYGHRTPGYWYNTNGEPTQNQCTELFAEYFSYYMTGDIAAINSMRNHLPTACDVLDEMIESMVQNLE